MAVGPQNIDLAGPVSDDQISPDGTIALVEDQANEREMLTSVLRLRGFNVITFIDGSAAIEYFQNNPPPSIMLIDVNMPRCDGPFTINALRNENLLDSTLVYAISGNSPSYYGLSIGGDGVDRWFPKPLNPEHLFKVLDAAS